MRRWCDGADALPQYVWDAIVTSTVAIVTSTDVALALLHFGVACLGAWLLGVCLRRKRHLLAGCNLMLMFTNAVLAAEHYTLFLGLTP